jgi:hypothetical protein
MHQPIQPKSLKLIGGVDNSLILYYIILYSTTHVHVFCLLQLKPEEVAGMIKDFDEPGTLAPTGLFVGGTKYMVIQGEPGVVIRGKKVQWGTDFLIEEML